MSTMRRLLLLKDCSMPPARSGHRVWGGYGVRGVHGVRRGGYASRGYLVPVGSLELLINIFQGVASCGCLRTKSQRNCETH